MKTLKTLFMAVALIAAALPAFAGKTVFVNGNPATGTPGTRVTAEFLNSVNNHYCTGLDSDGDCALAYASASGATNAYVVTLSPALTEYVIGMPLFFGAANANTGPSTVNYNGLGALAIKKNTTQDLESGDIHAGQVVQGFYDGTNFQLVNATMHHTHPAADITDYSSLYIVGESRTFNTVNGCPSGWFEEDGSQKSRTSYSALFSALTITDAGGSFTSGSAVVTGLASTALMGTGMPVSGPKIQSGTIIQAVNSSTQITMSKTATSSGVAAIVVAPHGVGDGSTTFNLPDMRRRTAIGAGGTGAGNVGTYLGNYGGEETHTLSPAEMPSHTHSYTTVGGTPLNAPPGGAAAGGTGATTGSAGSGQAHNLMQPSYVKRVCTKY